MSVDNCSEYHAIYDGLEFVFLIFHSIFFVTVLPLQRLFIFCDP